MKYVKFFVAPAAQMLSIQGYVEHNEFIALRILRLGVVAYFDGHGASIRVIVWVARRVVRVGLILACDPVYFIRRHGDH